MWTVESKYISLMIITATSNKALTMIVVCVVFSVIIGASSITQPASGSNSGNISCVHPNSGTYESHNNDMTAKENDDYNDYGTQSYFGQQNYVPPPFSVLEPNWENILCIHPNSGTYKSHNNDMTKQNNDYGTQSYFNQQIFRNIPYGSPFPLRNIPYGSPFPLRNIPYGLPFSNDYGSQPYFAQHKFRNDPFELPFP
jgi:ABC-type transport system involved in multi-copper enzyme maturation permease subunit